MNQNLPIADPTLADALQQSQRIVSLAMNCHSLATIQSFDPVTQTVQASINYLQSVPITSEQGVPSTQTLRYPVLLEVPVIILQGGSGALTMPIAAGDTCLILFNDRDMDNWLHSGQVTAPNSGRAHSFADGIALIGLNHANNKIQDYDPDRAVLRHGNAQVGVGLELVKIANEITTLKTLFNGLIDAIAAMPVVGIAPAGGGPITGGQVVGTAVTAYKSDIAGLLE